MTAVGNVRGRWARTGLAAVIGTRNPGREPVLARAALLRDRSRYWTVRQMQRTLADAGVAIS